MRCCGRCPKRALNVGEVSVDEAPGLSGAAVHGDANVSAARDVLEELVEVLVGGVERQVADEQGLGLGVGLDAHIGAVDVLDVQATAVERGLVHVLNGLGGLSEVGVLNVGKSDNRNALIKVHEKHGPHARGAGKREYAGLTNPLATPVSPVRGMRTPRTVPYSENFSSISFSAHSYLRLPT